MLTGGEIKLIAKVMGMRPFQQEKHYIQTVVLKTIYAHGDPAFKGGTALMFTQGLNRFSEDLDFTQRRDLRMNQLTRYIQEDLALYGIPAKIGKVVEEERGASFRIGAEGPLFTKEIERCYVRVEISKRETVILPPEMKTIMPLYPDVLPFTITVMAPQEILAEKIRALFMREKARDLFDAWFLITRGITTNRQIIDSKLAPYGQKYTEETFEARLQGLAPLWEPELRAIIIGKAPAFEQGRYEVVRFGRNIQ